MPRMSPRKLRALRNLAERPGTPSEGEVARAMLARAEATREEPFEAFARFLKTGRMEDLHAACDATERHKWSNA